MNRKYRTVVTGSSCVSNSATAAQVTFPLCSLWVWRLRITLRVDETFFNSSSGARTVFTGGRGEGRSGTTSVQLTQLLMAWLLLTHVDVSSGVTCYFSNIVLTRQFTSFLAEGISSKKNCLCLTRGPAPVHLLINSVVYLVKWPRIWK
jgi:hypothetical protein